MIVNTDLLKHPINWLIVLLMLVIAGTAGSLLLAKFGASPATGELPSEGEFILAGPSRQQLARAVLEQ
jgi:hypothetical protein